MTIDYLEVSTLSSQKLKFVVAPEKQLYQVRWDHEISDEEATRFGITSFTDRPNGRPMIFRTDPFDKTLLSAKLQQLWFYNIAFEGRGLTEDQLRQAWRWMTDHDRAYTNGVGCDLLRDYILMLRLNFGLPGIFPLLSGGACVAGNKTTWRGIRVLECEHIPESGIVPDTESLPWGASAITHVSHPWLIHYAVNSTKTKLTNDPSMPYGGSYLVNPWTTELWYGRNAPVPFIASEQVYYPLELLKTIPLGAPVPSPYNPPR